MRHQQEIGDQHDGRENGHIAKRTLGTGRLGITNGLSCRLVLDHLFDLSIVNHLVIDNGINRLVSQSYDGPIFDQSGILGFLCHSDSRNGLFSLQSPDIGKS